MITIGFVVDITYDAECIDKVTVQYAVKGVPYMLRERVKYNSNGQGVVPAIGEITTGMRVRVEYEQTAPDKGHLIDNVGLAGEDAYE